MPHIEAGSQDEAWFGMGFACAQDRIWQMDADRRKGLGRFAEVAGPGALSADILARRLRLVDAAKRDLDILGGPARAMLEAYAAGVNAFLESGAPLAPEYGLTGTRPEAWQPWHSLVVFVIRHVLMGVWQLKVCQGILLSRVGEETFRSLDVRPPVDSLATVPPGRRIRQAYERAGAEIAEVAPLLGFLAETEAGSNAWVVHGSRTTTGRPVLCNDSHRRLDVPNVYWQAQLTCPAFTVAGAAFPGIPGFPHFGHNGSVAWAITHTHADTQDLYVEQFDRDDPTRYRTPEGFVPADRRQEWIEVRGGDPVVIDTWATRHGPVVHGDPRTGLALALRYTAIDAPSPTFDVLPAMLSARTVPELFECQRDWIDPVNNMLAADTQGSIGYLTRGRLPLRSSTAHHQVPAAGWTGEHEWIGFVPFEAMPRAIDPPEGFVVSANQVVSDRTSPFIAYSFNDPFRAERIVELLARAPRLSPQEIARIQGDVTSWPAQRWAACLPQAGPFEGPAERARERLSAWDGELAPGSANALLYACFRRALAGELFRPRVGDPVWGWLTTTGIPAAATLIRRWLANAIWPSLRAGRLAPALEGPVRAALAFAWGEAAALAGPDPSTWRWDAYHRTDARHPLAPRHPEAAWLNPPAVPIGGDSDTVQVASYGWQVGTRFDIGNVSVYRQVVDLAALDEASSVIPGGASGDPSSPHASDQLPLWSSDRRIPMSGT